MNSDLTIEELVGRTIEAEKEWAKRSALPWEPLRKDFRKWQQDCIDCSFRMHSKMDRLKKAAILAIILGAINLILILSMLLPI